MRSHIKAFYFVVCKSQDRTFLDFFGDFRISNLVFHDFIKLPNSCGSIFAKRNKLLVVMIITKTHDFSLVASKSMHDIQSQEIYHNYVIVIAKSD